MALDSGYAYLVLDSLTFTRNPTTREPFKAVKLVANITTLTKTIRQSWNIDATDKFATYYWANLDATTKASLLTLYEASYTSYVFTDEYNVSHNVLISDLTIVPRGTVDSYGFEVTMQLLKV